MDISHDKKGASLVVSVVGRMDTTSAPELESQFQEWIAKGESQFVVDLSQLEYISSAGLRVLISAAKTAKAKGGRLACCGLTGVVKKVFDISGFSTLLPVYESVEQATLQD